MDKLKKLYNLIKSNDIIKYVLIIGLFVLLLQVQTCRHNLREADLKAQYEHLASEGIENFETVKKDGVLIASQTQIILDQKSAIVKKEEQISQLKNLKASVKFKTVYIVAEKEIPFKDTTDKILTVVDTTTKDTSLYVKMPQPFEKSDSSLTLKGFVDTGGVHIDTLSLTDNVTIDIGDRKGTLFKLDPIVKIRHTSPYANQATMSNVIVDPEIYKKTKKSFIVGFTVGFVTVAVPVAVLSYFLAKK